MTRDKGGQSAKAKTLSANRLRELLNYAPATGIFRWRGGKGVVKGKVAGSVRSRGPIIIRIDGKLYRANRLAWLYMTGKWPKQEIGYINRNTSDTRWANLWVMTPSQRGASTRRRNKLGVRGVWITKSGKYVAYIRVAGKKKVSWGVRHGREGQRGLHQSGQRRVRAIRDNAVIRYTKADID